MVTCEVLDIQPIEVARRVTRIDQLQATRSSIFPSRSRTTSQRPGRDRGRSGRRMPALRSFRPAGPGSIAFSKLRGEHIDLGERRS